MTTQKLRARLGRLEQQRGTVIGQTRWQAMMRRHVLDLRKFSKSGRTAAEEKEFAQLNAQFEDEDRRLEKEQGLDLVFKKFRMEKLTEAEESYLADRRREFRPDPEDPLTPSLSVL
jgi:hypothetical protein